MFTYFRTRFLMSRLLKKLDDRFFVNPSAMPENSEEFARLINTPAKQKALNALVDAKCVAWRKNLSMEKFLVRGERSTLYLLERSDLWINRIVSFILGMLTSLIMTFLTGSLRLPL